MRSRSTATAAGTSTMPPTLTASGELRLFGFEGRADLFQDLAEAAHLDGARHEGRRMLTTAPAPAR